MKRQQDHGQHVHMSMILSQHFQDTNGIDISISDHFTSMAEALDDNAFPTLAESNRVVQLL